MITAEEESELEYLQEQVKLAEREVTRWQSFAAKHRRRIDVLTRKAQDEDE